MPSLKDTLQKLYEGAMERKDCGMAASVTTDEEGVINFPYLYAKGRKPEVYDEKKRFSFCCTLLTPAFLRAFDFHLLDASKNWFDVTISHESIKKGFHNYLFIFKSFTAIHRYSPLFTAIHRYSPLFTAIHRYSPIFTDIHRSSAAKGYTSSQSQQRAPLESKHGYEFPYELPYPLYTPDNGVHRGLPLAADE